MEDNTAVYNAGFPLELDPTAVCYETLNWTLPLGKLEVYVPLLAKYDWHDIVSHCVTAMFHIEAKVTTPAERYLLYQDVFPRTLSIPLRATWDNIVAEHPLKAGTRNVQGFQGLICLFIKAHATDDDRCELVDYLRHAPKPRTMGVCPYYYRLRDLNKQVPWLPGTKAKLTTIQLDQAFHDGMPHAWQDRYANAGHSIATDNHADILHFFCKQQATVNRSVKANIVKQKTKKSHDGQEQHPVRFAAVARQSAKFCRGGDKDKGSFKKKGAKSRRISDDNKCPVHPQGNHTWGDCFQNFANKDKKKSATAFKGKDKSKSKPAERVDVNAMMLDDEDASMTATVASNKCSEEFLHTNDKAINNPLDQDNADNIDGRCAQLNEHAADPEDLVKQFKDRKAAKAAAEAVGTFYAFVSISEPFTHHLDELSLLAMQESTTNVMCDDYVDTYMKFMDDAYSAGVSEINGSIVPNLDSVLHLRATSYAIVKSMQHSNVDCLLRVLFDSGSDKMLMKQSALPKGINLSQGKKHKVTGVTSSMIMDREIIIENMTLPKFLSTQRVSGPVRVLILANNDSPYDLIIGMDLMQILGIDIHNSSKTIVWDALRVPFKPHDYFMSGKFQANLLKAMAGSADPIESNGYKSKTIKSALYEANDPRAVAKQQKHLTPSQRQDLADLLSRYPKLFSGKLGQCPHLLVHLELKPDATPARCRPYPVPKHHETVFKEELKHLCTLGVLSRCSASEWLTPSSLTRTDKSVGSPTFGSLTSTLSAKFITCPRYKISCLAAPAMRYSVSWIYPCNTILLNLMKRAKTSVRFVHRLVTIVTTDYLWVSRSLRTLHKKLWKRSSSTCEMQ
jgi:hypothetical protein